MGYMKKKWILFLFNSSEFQWKIIDIWIQLFAMGGWGFQRIQNKSTFYFHCTGGFLFDYGCMLSSSLNPTIFLYLWEIELFSLCTTPHHRKLFKHLDVTYSQVWYIIGIVSSIISTQKIGLIRVTYDPPVSARLTYVSLFFCFKSDCIELDFKEISYLVTF